jgi:fatty acid synthase
VITAICSGCEVWTTVSSAAKRNYLLSTFPDLKRENIGHSRSQSFVKTVMNGTRGQGVDIVLNSLSGKLIGGLRYCAFYLIKFYYRMKFPT